MMEIPPEILAALQKEDQTKYVRQLWNEASEGMRDLLAQIQTNAIDPMLVTAIVSTLIVLYFQIKYYDREFEDRWKKYVDTPSRFQSEPHKIREFYADIGDILYTVGLLDVRSPLSEVRR